MGFLIYKKTVNDGIVTYTKIKPLKASGSNGPIAKYVKTLSDAQLRAWRLSPVSLAALAEPGLSSDGVAVLFDVSAPSGQTVSIYEVRQVCGSCREVSTDLALDLAILVDQDVGSSAAEYIAKFDVPIANKLRRFGETLSLSGGPGGGDWKWGAPKMQLGATVV